MRTSCGGPLGFLFRFLLLLLLLLLWREFRFRLLLLPRWLLFRWWLLLLLWPFPLNPPPPSLDNPAISDENDFGAVASRQSIESDARRIAANQQQYEVIAPIALPERRGNQANIVPYALSTSHPRGTKIYRRLGVGLGPRSQRKCAGYASADLAQVDFLGAGGPEKDRLNLDPDGDGYACGWDPRPFRSAVEQG